MKSVIELAREADFDVWTFSDRSPQVQDADGRDITKQIEALAALVRQDQRERDAEKCKELAVSLFDGYTVIFAEQCADAILAGEE